MMESASPITRLGPVDRPVVHSYYDVCPESPSGSRAIVTVFESDTIPGPARVCIVDLKGAVLQTIGEPVEVNGHVGRFALWIDDERIAFRHGADGGDSDWSMLHLTTGEETRHSGALRQWHAGIGRGLVQWQGNIPNSQTIRQGIRVVDDQGRTIAEADVRDCVATVPDGTPTPPIEQLDVKNFKWSPDGGRFFVVLNTEYYRRHVSSDGMRFKTIVSFDPGLQDGRFLGHFGHHPTWSGDGTCVYAMNVRDDGCQNLVALSADDSGRTRVVLTDAPGIHGSLTPDGRYLIIDVREDDGGVCAIARIDLKTGERTDLARFAHTRWLHDSGNHPHPVISPDGRRVYFNAQADGRCGCYVMDIETE